MATLPVGLCAAVWKEAVASSSVGPCNTLISTVIQALATQGMGG